MAGVTFSGHRETAVDQSGYPILAVYDSQDYVVCYDFSVDYTGKRALTGLSIETFVSVLGGGSSGTITAYLYTTNPFAGGQTSVPSGYVATAPLYMQDVYGSLYTFTFTSLSITDSAVYVLFKVTSGFELEGIQSLVMRPEVSTTPTGTFLDAANSLSVSPTTVTTGGSVSVTIGNAAPTETVLIYYGSTLLDSATISNGIGTISVPKSWFTTAGVTNSTSMTVQARVDGTNVSANFTVQAGSDMKPAVATPTVTSASGTSCLIAAAVTAGSNAAIQTVTLSYSGSSVGMTYNSSTGKYEATVSNLSAGTILTVTATDQRGLSGFASVSYGGQPSDLSLTPSVVNTGGTLNINVNNAVGTGSVIFTYNGTQLGTATITNGSGSLTVPKSWFSTAGVTTSQTMSVHAQVDGSSLGGDFTVQAGSDMKPTVGPLTATIVQDPSAIYFPHTYIQNVSKAKIAASVSAGSNASISSVVMTYAGGEISMSYNSSTMKYEGTSLALGGNTVFTVTATDQRGLTATSTYILAGVVSYTAPAIVIDRSKTYRCDNEGTKADDGSYFKAKASVTVTTAGLSGNSLQSLRVYIQEEPSKSYTLVNDVQSSEKLGRSADYFETLVFEASDRVQTVTRTLRLQAASRNFAMRRSADGTYIGVGMLPQRSTGKSSIELDEGGAYLDGGYLWGSLTRLHSAGTTGSQFSKNFLNVDTSNLYALSNTECFFIKDSDSGWSNFPVSGAFQGVRKVIYINSTHVFVMILEAEPTAGRIWVNFYDGSIWSGWKSHTPV